MSDDDAEVFSVMEQCSVARLTVRKAIGRAVRRSRSPSAAFEAEQVVQQSPAEDTATEVAAEHSATNGEPSPPSQAEADSRGERTKRPEVTHHDGQGDAIAPSVEPIAAQRSEAHPAAGLEEEGPIEVAAAASAADIDKADKAPSATDRQRGQAVAASFDEVLSPIDRDARVDKARLRAEAAAREMAMARAEEAEAGRRQAEEAAAEARRGERDACEEAERANARAAAAALATASAEAAQRAAEGRAAEAEALLGHRTAAARAEFEATAAEATSAARAAQAHRARPN
ncbi:hypothetical protein OAO87_03260 [bacterium]|nr:hypothetical protein [bacterium]